MQENSQISNVPPLSGVDLVDQANKALQTIATDFAGADDPASTAWPYATWADTANNLRKRRNAAGTTWIVEGVLLKGHVPTLLSGDIPATDIGAIYVVGVGMMTWDGAQYSSDQATGIVRTGGFKNALINGNFAVNQRVVSGTVTLAAGAYGHDRWKAGASGCTYTFTTSNNVTTITITAGSLVQVIEGMNLFSGTYTLSWSGSAQGKIGAGSYAASGVTATVTGGSNLSIEFGTGTLSKAQFEMGGIATTFENVHFDRQLEACQRYYEKSFPYSTAPAQNTGALAGAERLTQVVGASSVQIAIGKTVFKVRKRTTPTFTAFNPNAANANPRNVQRSQDWGNASASVTVSDTGVGWNSWTSSASSAVGDDFSVHWTAEAEL